MGGWGWSQHFFGYCAGCGDKPPYLFFSGWGSILLPWILQALTFGAILWWHHQCHVTGCFWPARRKTAARERACWRHHPERHRTVEDLHEAHRRAKAGLPPAR